MISRDTIFWFTRCLFPELLLGASLILYWLTRDVWMGYTWIAEKEAIGKAIPFYLALTGVAGHLIWRCARLIRRARSGRDFGDILSAVLYPLLFVFFFGIFLSLTSDLLPVP